jgi:hypothetical protein
MLKPSQIRLVIVLASMTLPHETFTRRFRQFCAGFGFKFLGVLWGVCDIPNYDWTQGEPKLRGNMRCGR